VHVFSLEVGKPAQAKPATPPISVVAAPPQKRRSALIPLAGGIVAIIVIAAVAAWYFLVRPSANIAANAPAHLSIVVLPFANLSGDPKQDYFADGITDNLTTDLSRTRTAS
jgi:adenylate cyclase